MRATVAHDSYERLVEVRCLPAENAHKTDRSGVQPLPERFQDPNEYGINLEDFDRENIVHSYQNFRRQEGDEVRW